ncbi:RsmB/NOP family class I SAM-dependent RNA methyltransferase [Luteolibacter sp. AS25]|uniref:RsmB/NOP family class I SAM-dependent RNA methyltransferase n=1 Tax=Luteolibacter sp. AS25 TaxID=3135776 RepID=UPI00398AFC24
MPAKNFHVRQAAVSALRAWAKGHDYAESLVERHSQRRKLSASDRGLLQAILFGVLRHRRLLDHWISTLREGKLDAETRDVLRVGLCQILILQIPDHAAVNETVEAGKAPVRSLINACLRKAITNRKKLMEDLDDLPAPVLYSHPDWLFNRWRKSFGKQRAIAIMEWNNQPAETYFRTNPLSANTPEDLPGKKLKHASDYYLLEGKIPTALLASGDVYIQDPATRHCVELLAPQPGEKVLDACAAPGGKAFLIAAALGGGKGLVCTDSNDKRIPRLEDNLKRLHITPDEMFVHDWRKPAPAHLHGTFDAILLDVPCSNTGVIRRRVDVRWRLQTKDIEDLGTIQTEILENALSCLKPGGRIVYSTCSIEDLENIELVQAFVKKHPELVLEKSVQITPEKHSTDGAFAALLRLK